MLETGTADRPRGSRQVAQDPYYWYNGPEDVPFVHAPDPPRDSDTQGLGKSPGMRWPWQRFFQSRAPNVAYHSGGTGGHWRHELPSRILVQGERGPLSANYLNYYEQAPRHVWPGGGVIDYQPSVPVVAIARRIGEAQPGVAG
jgi:hypothetical protein